MNIPYVLGEVRAQGLRFVLHRRGYRWASRRSMANLALNNLERRQGRARLISNPIHLQIEPTTACNLSCTLCGRQTAWSELRRHSRFLPWNVFTKLVPFLRTARQVDLYGWGESFLHPDLTDMLNVCKHEGAVVDITTNGLLLSPDVAQAIVAGGLDRLTISLEGANAETYRAVRGADLAILVDNLEGLAETKRRAKRRFPYVRFQFCIMRHNYRELPLLVKLAHRCGVGEIGVNNLIVYGGDLSGQSVFGLDQEVDEVHAQASRLARRLGISFIYKGVQPFDSKRQCPFGSFSVLCDGSVGFCGAQRVLTGNIHDASLRELWNSPSYQTARRQFATGEYTETCRRCPNHSNSIEDHETPDMSYVTETLAARRWDQAEKRVTRLPLVDPKVPLPQRPMDVASNSPSACFAGSSFAGSSCGRHSDG